MFTGIVSDMGQITEMNEVGDSIKFNVHPIQKNYLKNVKKGDSIAINGACMTIISKKAKFFEFTTVKESLSKTNLGNLSVGNFVNLEKPMSLNGSIDGHLVMGHIDTTGKVFDIKKLKDSWEFFFTFSGEYRDNIIYVGSISINGVSLTIADIVRESVKEILIKIAIIPHTFEVTNFRYMKQGDRVNLEFDMIGKFVKRSLEGQKKK